MKYKFLPPLKREMERMVSRPLYILMLIVLPLLSFSVFWFLFEKGVPEDLPIAVYDRDGSSISRQLIRMMDSASSIQIKYRVNSLEEGKRLILRGKCNALVMIPRNLEKDVLSGLSPSVIHFYNNEFLLAGSLINRDIKSIIMTFSKGVNVTVRQTKGEMAVAAMAHIEPVHIVTYTLFNPYLNYSYFLTGTLQPALLQIFIIMMTVFSVGSELKDGTAKSLMVSSGNSTIAALTAKLLPYTMIFTLLGIFMNVLLFVFFTVPITGSLVLILFSTVIFVLAYQSMGLFCIAVTSNLRFGLSMAGFYSTPAFAFAGVTFPLIGMPISAKIWSHMLPLTYYIKIFIDQSMKGAPVIASLPDVGMMSCFILTGIIAVPRLDRLLKNSEYWGRL